MRWVACLGPSEGANGEGRGICYCSLLCCPVCVVMLFNGRFCALHSFFFFSENQPGVHLRARVQSHLIIQDNSGLAGRARIRMILQRAK